MNIVKSTASLFGKATKLVVSLTGSTFSTLKAGYVEGYTGINATPVVVEAQEPPVAPTVQTVVAQPQPVQQEFNFTQQTAE